MEDGQDDSPFLVECLARMLSLPPLAVAEWSFAHPLFQGSGGKFFRGMEGGAQCILALELVRPVPRKDSRMDSGSSGDDERRIA